jgi:hypothetical protein
MAPVPQLPGGLLPLKGAQDGIANQVGQARQSPGQLFGRGNGLRSLRKKAEIVLHGRRPARSMRRRVFLQKAALDHAG